MDNKNIFELKKKEKSESITVKWSANGIVLRVFILITCLKVLLIPT